MGFTAPFGEKRSNPRVPNYKKICEIRRKFVSSAFNLFIVLLLLFLSACQQGKWQAEGKFIFYGDGTADVTFFLFPIDKDAKISFDSVIEQIKKEDPRATVTEKKQGKERYIMVHKKLSAKSNFYLKQVNGRWQFHYLNQFYDNVLIRKMEVYMPGWILSTDAPKRYGNYALWDNMYEGKTYVAESTTFPFIYTIGLIFISIVVLLGGLGFWIILRKEKEDKMMETKSEILQKESDFKY